MSIILTTIRGMKLLHILCNDDNFFAQKEQTERKKFTMFTTAGVAAVGMKDFY